MKSQSELESSLSASVLSRPRPPPLGPPSQSSMEDYNQKSSSHRRSRHPRRTGGTTSRPRWTTCCLET